MNLSWTCAILSLLVFANAVSEEELRTFITLTKFEYEDSCSKTAESEWSFINKPTNNTRRLWENAANDYQRQKIKEVNETSAEIVETFNDNALEYAYNVVMKPGDALLESDDFRKLVSFASQAEMWRLTGYYTTGTKKHFRKDVERQLARNGKAADKLAAWSSWHQTLTPLAANFSKNLQLVQKAAVANGKDSVEEYWEMLSGLDNAYERIRDEWPKLSQMRYNIKKIVKNRLATKHRMYNKNDSLPAHLLGSLRGDDWTNLALDILEYSNLVPESRIQLWKMQIDGETLYKEASKMGNIILKHVPQADFWNESNFGGQCPSHLVNLCHDGKMRVSTCSEVSIGNFMTAHKNVAKVVVNQMSRENEPILGVANRYSALEEGVAEFFGILSVSQAWLNSQGLIDNHTDMNDIQMVSMMITVLDVFPRLSYYLAADTWRIDTIKNNTYEPSELASTWWKYRLEYEDVNTSVPDLPTFLDDDYITGNRPYLSKFLGILLGFQIYEYVMESEEIRFETIEISRIENQHKLSKMVRQGYGNNWTEVIEKYMEINEVSADSLVSYFSLWDNVFVTFKEFDWPKYFRKLNEQQRELDASEDVSIKIINEPWTTTTQPSTIKPTTLKSVKSKNVSLFDDVKSTISTLSENPKISKNVDTPTVNKTRGIPIETEIVRHDKTDDTTKKPKQAQNKAVWAVGAVLVATVIICIIAIFGKQRCRRAPKNRRYV